MSAFVETAKKWLDTALVLLAFGLSGALAFQWFRGGPASEGGMISLDGWEADLKFPRRIGTTSDTTNPYTLVVWTDYQCPACRMLEVELARLREKVGDSLVVVYRNFPLPGHDQARSAAILAQCAWEQGRFEAMHVALFRANIQNDQAPNASTFAGIASIPDTAAFVACTTGSAAAEAVDADIRRGAEIGIRATPALQIGSRIGTGVQMADSLHLRLQRARR